MVLYMVFRATLNFQNISSSTAGIVSTGIISANQQKQLRNNAFHVKTSQSTKNLLNPAKNENHPKK